MGYPKDMNDYAYEISEWAKTKGFWDIWERNGLNLDLGDEDDILKQQASDKEMVVQLLLAKVALIHTEVSEAAEEIRVGNWKKLEEELADIIIRVLDMAGTCGFNIQQAVSSKVSKNHERPHRHGKLA